MARKNVAPRGEASADDDVAQFLHTEERVLRFLRAAMLESGDDPAVMAIALSKAQNALARVRRVDPARARQLSPDPSRLNAKRSA